ncbi:OTU domain containing protein [Hyaloscypha variabilis]
MPQKRKHPDMEFPLLKTLGLMTIKTTGGGSCLFNSFSDQLYGNEKRGNEIRAKVVQEMRDNANRYKDFFSTEVGGGYRRNPRRKTAAAVEQVSTPTPEQLDKDWNLYLVRMSKKTTYADSLEIKAFAYAFNVDVKVYEQETVRDIRAEGEGTGRQVVHVAYHNYEHYSSVRKIDGTLPNVQSSSGTLESGQSGAAPPNVPQCSDTLVGDEEEEEIRGPNKRQRCGTMAKDSEITITIKIKIKGRKGVKHVTLPKSMKIVFA